MPKKIPKKTEKKGKDPFKGMDVRWEKKDGKALYIETSIDRLYDLVKERKTLSFTEAQKEFGVEKDQIASWAKIIEDHKLAKVHYPIFGSPMIIFMEKREKAAKNAPERPSRPPGRKLPKIMVALAGGLLIFFGYTIAVTNAFTISMRAQIGLGLQRIAGLFQPVFGPLQYPLNVITPFAIVIVIVWAFAGFRRKKRKSGKGGLEGRLEKIKKELGS